MFGIVHSKFGRGYTYENDLWFLYKFFFIFFNKLCSKSFSLTAVVKLIKISCSAITFFFFFFALQRGFKLRLVLTLDSDFVGVAKVRPYTWTINVFQFHSCYCYPRMLKLTQTHLWHLQFHLKQNPPFSAKNQTHTHHSPISHSPLFSPTHRNQTI